MDGEHGPAPRAGMPKRAQVAARVRAQIADGVLAPGESAPSGAQLARVTGYSVLTCRRALQTLIKEGALVPGPSPGARPRVPAPDGEGLTSAARALSAALVARRRAAGLTQPQLAEIIGVSVTTIGHAETARLWHGRSFWERADKELRAGGELLRHHDAYRAATVPPSPARESGQQPEPDRQAEPMNPAETTQTPPPAQLLTPDEHEAVRQAGLLYTMIASRIIADGPAKDDDLAEIRAAIHLIQRAVLAQAAARAFPREFRQLGTVIAQEARRDE
jgi:DNA-binding GntR family transcriptional regulator